MLWQLSKTLHSHRFQAEVGQLFISLQEAQVLALSYQTDLKLSIDKKKGEMGYRFSTLEPFPETLFLSKQINLKEIAKVTVNGKGVDKAEFDLFHTGLIEPRGVLCFFPKEGVGVSPLYVDFQGGHLLKFSYQKPHPSIFPIPERV